MNRLAAPWQLIRLAVKAAQSDDAALVAATPYAVAVEIVLAEMERMVAELTADLKRGSNVPVTSLLKGLHDGARGLRTELDLPVEQPWGRRLAAIRVEISSVLKAEIESTPGRVRRLLRPRPASEIVPGSTLNSGDVADTEALIELVGACRNYAGELAVSEMTTRAYGELLQYLDTGTQDVPRGPAPCRAGRIGRSGSRRSTPPCASAARCSARNMPRCSPRRPRVASHSKAAERA